MSTANVAHAQRLTTCHNAAVVDTTLDAALHALANLGADVATRENLKTPAGQYGCLDLDMPDGRRAVITIRIR